MGNIQQAWNWAITTCNKANVGYSQAYRNQRTVNGITYYDCSSFIWYALLAGGYDCVGASGTAWPFTTYTMPQVLTALGFTQYDPTAISWKPGDILLNSGHTEMCYNGYVTMGAHNSSYPLDRQVSINNYNTTPSTYTSLWRDNSGFSSSWVVRTIADDGYQNLTQSEQEINAETLYSYLFGKISASVESVSALCGVAQKLSTINPGFSGNGIGLFLWNNTRRTALENYCSSVSLPVTSGEAQSDFIIDELTNTIFTVTSNAFPYIAIQHRYTDGILFVQDSDTGFTTEERVAWVLNAYYFQGNTNQSTFNDLVSECTQYAESWLTFLGGVTPSPPGPAPSPNERHKMPLWMYLYGRPF